MTVGIKEKKIGLGISGVVLVIIIIFLIRGISKDDFTQIEHLPIPMISEKDLSKKTAKPKKYHIEVSQSSGNVISEEEWNKNTKKSMEQSDILNNIEKNNAFSGGHKNSEKYLQRIEVIDKRINEYQKLVKQNPKDQNFKDKLNNLLQMKSIVTNLEMAVVIKEK